MRRLVSIGLICAAVAFSGCIGDDGPFGATTAATPASGAHTSITGVSNTAASAWTTPPPPGYQVQRPVVVQPPQPTFAPTPPTLQPAPIQPAPVLPPPSAAPTAPAPELPSWTPPAPPPVEEAPVAPESGGGAGCGGGKG